MRWLLVIIGVWFSSASASFDASQVAVVFNADSLLSRTAADKYCRTRGVPESHKIGLTGLSSEDVSRQDYERKVVMPLLRAADLRGWRWPAGLGAGRKPVRAMVLMPDLPLRVKEDAGLRPKGKGENPLVWRNGASLDAELMFLGARHATPGFIPNPYYKRDAFDLDDAAPQLLPVCRIDGPNVDCIRRMIEDPAEVEKRGLWGWVVVDRGGPYPKGDRMLEAVARLASQGYLPVFHETSRKTLAESFPLMSRVAIYFGWYTEWANGPFRPGAPGGFRFAPGAVAAHLHSYSAVSIKDDKRWVGALLNRGASVTMGNVAEPFLDGCIDFEVFYARLMRGCAVAEALLMATPVLSWQSVVLGDPLYRPYAAVPSSRPDGGDPFVRWRRLCLRTAGKSGEFDREFQALLSSASAPLFAEIYAAFCSEKKNEAVASRYFAMAAQGYSDVRDQVRCLMFQAAAERACGNTRKSEEILLRCASVGLNTPYASAIREVAKAKKGQK